MILDGGNVKGNKRMDKSTIMTSRHSFLAIETRLPKTYLTIKKKHTNSFMHLFTCPH